MNWSQGPGRSLWLPTLAERWVLVRVAARGARVGTLCPAEPGAPCAAPALPPCGPHPLWAPELLGCNSRGAREQALPALLLPGSRVPGAGGPGARVLSASSSFLLSPAPISPFAFKARGYSPD